MGCRVLIIWHLAAHRCEGFYQNYSHSVFRLFNVTEYNFTISVTKFALFMSFTANWLEARTIKYTNFPAKYMNSRSKLHWNIHVVLCQVGVTWNNRCGIGIPELRDQAERHSTFNSSPKWILLIIYFYGIFWVFSPLMWCQQVYWH